MIVKGTVAYTTCGWLGNVRSDNARHWCCEHVFYILCTMAKQEPIKMRKCHCAWMQTRTHADPGLLLLHYSPASNNTSYKWYESFFKLQLNIDSQQIKNKQLNCKHLHNALKPLNYFDNAQLLASLPILATTCIASVALTHFSFRIWKPDTQMTHCL